MSCKQLDHLTARMFDHPLRYHVESAQRPHVTHLCELDLYRGNGKCSCEYFDFTLSGILAQGISPEDAVARGLIDLVKQNERRLKKGRQTKDVRDALRCDHLIEARRQHADDMIAAISQNETTHRTEKKSLSKAELAEMAREDVREEIRAAHAG